MKEDSFAWSLTENSSFSVISVYKMIMKLGRILVLMIWNVVVLSSMGFL